MKSRLNVALAMAYRQTTILVKNPSLFVPPMLFPLMNFAAFGGGLSQLRHVRGFDFHGGYTAFQFVFVLLQSAAFGGVFAGSGSRATSSAASPGGCSWRRPSAPGLSSATDCLR
jgi:hypothetical protein